MASNRRFTHADVQGNANNGTYPLLSRVQGNANNGTYPLLSPGTSWTFSNLAPNYQTTYDVYVYSTATLSGTSWQNGYTVKVGGNTVPANATPDPAAPSLGGNWYFWGTVTTSASSLSVNSSVGGGLVCLMQQTSAAGYDADGEVTATTDAMGRVSASCLNPFGQTVAGYQGQILSNASVSSWTFSNLAPNYQTSYGLYVYSTTDPINAAAYHIAGSTPATDPTAPSLGGDWYYWGTVTDSALSLTVTGPGNGGTLCLMQQTSATVYDADGNTISTTDAMGRTTTSAYDNLGRLWTTTQPTANGVTPVTRYTYDADGNELSETDPDNNQTTYTYNGLNQRVSQIETMTLTYGGSPTPYTTNYGYDADGNLIQETDAKGRVTVFEYDSANLETGEQWYTTPSKTSETNAIAYTYDADGELLTAQDTYASPNAGESSGYTYAYNSLGEEISVDNNAAGMTGTPGVPDVVLASTYDAAGNRLSLSATIGGTADFVNGYSYDDLNREYQVTQSAGGGDAVDPKQVNFTYNADGQFNTITRQASPNGTAETVATSSYGYDDFGRVTSLAQAALATTTYTYTYDADNEVLTFTNSAHANESVGSFIYDADGQLTGATQLSGAPNGANSLGNNTYDANGNAKNINGGSSTVVGAGNTQLFDGTYYDSYDANGNLVLQTNAASTAASTYEVAYVYDNRNRLTSVTYYTWQSSTWVPTQEVQYTYDMFDNLIGRAVTTYTNGSPTGTTTARYVFDGTNMVLAFDGSTDNLTDRYLWGPAVDQVLADEHFSLSGSNQLPMSASGTTLWALGDNQNSVRDVVTDTGAVEQHIAYSPFGQQVSGTGLTTTGSVVGSFPIGYTGTYTDPVTGYQLHGRRWYDPVSQRWLTQDPSGLAPDTNPYRYCRNAPTDGTDPSGRDDGGGPNANAPVWGGNLTPGQADELYQGLWAYLACGELASSPAGPLGALSMFIPDYSMSMWFLENYLDKGGDLTVPYGDIQNDPKIEDANHRAEKLAFSRQFYSTPEFAPDSLDLFNSIGHIIINYTFVRQSCNVVTIKAEIRKLYTFQGKHSSTPLEGFSVVASPFGWNGNDNIRDEWMANLVRWHHAQDFYWNCNWEWTITRSGRPPRIVPTLKGVTYH